MTVKRSIAWILSILLMLSFTCAAASDNAKQVVRIALRQVGKPYRLNADSPDSFNCASLVMYCYNSVKSGSITSRSINSLYKVSRKRSSLQAGDIVCFRTGTGRTPEILNYHFGIYCGNGYFVHAQRKKGVICTKLSRYRGKYLGSIRVF